MALANRAVHITIAGRVQGVGFRAFVEREAEARGVAGWVRNRRDGSVEAVFIGDGRAVERMLDACRKGPPLAEVADVQAAEYLGPPLTRFLALPTE